MSDFSVVIPARYASTRLPGKPLVLIGGKPMIVCVHERALQSGAREVLVATDDDRIANACRAAGARVEMTAPDHASGTDRIAELAHRFGWDDRHIVVNVQGDEPLIPPQLITQVAQLLVEHPEAGMATLVTPIRSQEEFLDTSVAKVVLDRDARALYFSRAPIPSTRDGAQSWRAGLRHIGLYAYRAGALRAIAAAEPCELELLEHLEQLRVLWLGFKVVAARATTAPPHAVDTPADLAAIRAMVEQG